MPGAPCSPLTGSLSSLPAACPWGSAFHSTCSNHSLKPTLVSPYQVPLVYSSLASSLRALEGLLAGLCPSPGKVP